MIELEMRRLPRAALFFAALATAVATSTTSWSHDTSEPTKTCIRAYESAQELRIHQDLLASRTALQACAATTCPAMIQSDCTEWLAEVAEAIPSIVLVATVGGERVFDVSVSMDGVPLTEGLDSKPLDINPGVHAFVFERPGLPRIEKKELVAAHGRQQLVAVQWDAAVAPATSSAKAPPNEARPRVRPVPAAVYVLGGASAAALATFAGFGLSGDAREHELQTSCSPRCSESNITALHTRFLVADIALGVAAASAVAAVVTLIVRPERPAPEHEATTRRADGREWSLDLRPSRNGAFVGWTRSF